MAASGKLDKAALGDAPLGRRDISGRRWSYEPPVSARIDASNYGYARLSDLFEDSGTLDVERTGGQPKVATVRLKKS